MNGWLTIEVGCAITAGNLISWFYDDQIRPAVERSLYAWFTLGMVYGMHLLWDLLAARCS